MNLQFKMDNNLSPPATSSNILVSFSIVFLYTFILLFSALIKDLYCSSSCSIALFILPSSPFFEIRMESIKASIISAYDFIVVASAVLYQSLLILLLLQDLSSMQ
jgi:hypothetical protein